MRPRRASETPQGLAAAVLAGLLAAACGRIGSKAESPPSYDIHQVLTRELLREANHGREVIGSDGRFVLPAGIRRVWVDVGAHHLETTKHELRRSSDMALFAIEPLAECWRVWPDDPRLIALPVAIDLERGHADFHVNANDSTSSLAPTVDGNPFHEVTRTVEIRPVPVLRLQDVLERIPRDVEVEYLKTDVQGLDLQVLKSAGESLRRVDRVKAEVIVAALYDGKGAAHAGTEAEFVAYMDRMGFGFVGDVDVQPERLWMDKVFMKRGGFTTAWRDVRRALR